MKLSSRLLQITSSAALLGISGVASAHPGHDAATAGFVGGLLHPLVGLDHLLAMLIVGVWAAQLGGRARLVVPAAFVTLMAGGAWLAAAGWPLPRVEAGIAASLLALGVLTTFAWRVPLALAAGIVGGFALFHGAAHGIELPLARDPLEFGAGMLLATAALHGIGLLLGSRLARSPLAQRVPGLTGVAAGVVLALS